MMGAWLKRVWRGGLGRLTDGRRRIPWPTREEIQALPAFEALTRDRIIEVASAAAATAAWSVLARERVVGFDTESQPTFVKGQVSTGPHVAQFATLQHAYVFMLHDSESRRAAERLITLETLTKAGFGLRDDLRQIRRTLNVDPRAVLDLESIFTQRGYVRGIGVKTAVAIALGRRFSKPKRASTSNWKRRRLSEKQLLYAANDAYAPLRVYHALMEGRRRP